MQVSGFLSFTEFEAILNSKEMQCLVSSMDVDLSDLQILYQLLDDGKGLISLKEFVTGLQGIKGDAKALDVVKICNALKRMDNKIDGIAHAVDQKTPSLDNGILVEKAAG